VTTMIILQSSGSLFAAGAPLGRQTQILQTLLPVVLHEGRYKIAHAPAMILSRLYSDRPIRGR